MPLSWRVLPSRPAIPSRRARPTPAAEQISIEAAQPKLDLGVLKDLSSRRFMLGVLDLGNPEIETAEDRRGPHPQWPQSMFAADRLVVAPTAA